MDFHLQNLRTGETLTLSPQRTLIGTAEHATVRTADGGPYLAALAVRYPAGWALYGLSNDPEVMVNRKPLLAGQRVVPHKGDLLAVGEERFTFLSPQGTPAVLDDEDHPAPTCFAYIRSPDGMEECRVVDHDLLFGRLDVCHVQLADTRLSRLGALLAAYRGEWYVHNLSKKQMGRNRKAVSHFAPVADGDELLIGPLVVRIEMQAAARGDPAGPTPPPSARFSALEAARRSSRPGPPPAATDLPEATDTPGPPQADSGPDLLGLHAKGQRLEQWLKSQRATPPPQEGGLRGWLDAQRDRLRRFWYDTPETTHARSLRTAGKAEEAFEVLDRAIRARPDGPELLRELYRLYEAVGLVELCYRPLRQIEKLAAARGAPDPWVLETLAKVCERLGRDDPAMLERALAYWDKLEAATGTSYTREKNAAMARRALREGGFAGAGSDGV